LSPGESLRDRLKPGRLEPREALRVARGVLVALEAAHGAGSVHGALRPESVLLGPDGAVALGSGSPPSPFYLAPEQREPGEAVDARADLYGWGVLLFEMLTGELPSGAETPSQVVPGLDPRLDQVFRRAWTRRAGRYGSAGAALADLEGLEGGEALPPRRAGGRPLRAGVLVRAAALLVDLALFAALGLAARSALVALAALLLSDAALVAAAGATPGKRLLGLRVAGADGARPGLGTAAARALARVLSFATLAGPLLALGRERWALHDRLAGTSVEHR